MRPKMQVPVKLSDESPGPIYPVSLADAKTHLRVDGTDEDDYISALIETATARLDGWQGELGYALISQTWRVDFDRFPGGRRLDLPMAPVQSVTVLYSDASNAEQTWAAANYALHEDDHGAYLWLDQAQDTWPDTYERRDAVRITMLLGYGPDAEDVPRPIRTAILQMVAHWFRTREAVANGGAPVEVPMSARWLIEDLKRPTF